MPLTAVWIIYGIVSDADGASIQLAFRQDIWYATRNFRPQRLPFRVILEECSGLPYRREFVSGLGHRCIVIWGALRVWIWGVICEWQSAMTKCRCKGIGQTSDLGLRLLGTVVLSEDGRNNDSEGSEELACAQNEHDKDSLRFLTRVRRRFRVIKEGKQLAGEGGGVGIAARAGRRGRVIGLGNI